MIEVKLEAFVADDWPPQEVIDRLRIEEGLRVWREGTHKDYPRGHNKGRPSWRGAMPGYTLGDAIRMLSEFRGHVERDLGPIVAHAVDTGSGYFVVPREVFAHLDFLGALYCGYDSARDGAGRRRIATTEKAVAFIADVLGEVDLTYREHARLAYEMFRHGTIHVSRPHLLRRPDGATIEFVTYAGERSNAPILYDGRGWRVSHLHPQSIEPERFMLPLSINVLYDDLRAGIDRYSAAVQQGACRGGATLLQNFATTMSALLEADPTNETW